MIFSRNINLSSKRILRLMVLSLLLVVMMLGLTGCKKASASLETALTLTEDGSGTRVMKLTLSKSDYKKAFSGVSIDSLGSKITDSCPKGMEFSYSDDGKQYVFTFSVPFKNIGEYEEIASVIMGENISIIDEEPESVFTTGLHYEEDFSTLDLIGWVAGPMSELTDGKTILSEVLQPDQWVVKYRDTEYHGSAGPLVIDTLIETPVERIDILTLLKQNQTCTRQVIFTFSQESMSKNEKQIKKYLAAAVPETATSNWEQSGQKATFTVSDADMTAEELAVFMKNLFSSESCKVTDKTSKSSYIFDSDLVRTEVIDLSAFLYETCPKIALGYYVQYENGMDITVTLKDAKDSQNLKKSDVYGGYLTAFEKTVSRIQFTTDIEADYFLENIDVNTVFHKEDNVTRTISLVFAQKPSSEQLEEMRKKIAAKAESYAEVTADVSGNKNAIVITQTGAMAFLNEGFQKIFGITGQLSHQSSGKLMAFKHNGTFSDVVDFTNFIKNDGYLTTVNYNLTMQSGESIVQKSVSSTISLNDGEEKINTNKYSGSLTGGFLSITLSTEVWNTDGIMLFVLILGLFLGILVVLLCAKGISIFLGRDKTPGPDNQGEGYNRVGAAVKRARGSISKAAAARTKVERDHSRPGRTVTKVNKGYVTEEKITFGDPDDDMAESSFDDMTGSGFDDMADNSSEPEAVGKKSGKKVSKKRRGFTSEETITFTDDDSGFYDDPPTDYKQTPPPSVDRIRPAAIYEDEDQDYFEAANPYAGHTEPAEPAAASKAAEQGPFTSRMNADREKKDSTKAWNVEDNIQRISDTIFTFMFENEDEDGE